jgi:hypothetical protein
MRQTGYVDSGIRPNAWGSAKVAIMLAGDLRDLGAAMWSWKMQATGAGAQLLGGDTSGRAGCVRHICGTLGPRS